jgi:hypothetical protein
VFLCIDFDRTIADGVPLRLLPGAREAIMSLRRAGHTLMLFSARANRATRFNPELDPLVRAGVRPVPREDEWQCVAAHHHALYAEMLAFVACELPGAFDAIDDGEQGKPICDLFIDDRAINPRDAGGPLSSGWDWIARVYGEPGPAACAVVASRR